MEGMWIYISAGCFLVVSILVLLLFNRERKKIRRELGDRLVPQYKRVIKPPTHKFQKYLPSKCPHHTGIWRTVSYKVLDETIEKRIFVCADCVSVVEQEEMQHRDKFTRQL